MNQRKSSNSIFIAQVLAVFVPVSVVVIETGLGGDKQKMSSKVELRSAESFEAVARIFESRCITCHNANNTEGGLAIHNRQRLLEGGESGVVIDAGDPESSLLLDYVRGPEAFMPPEGAALTNAEVAAIENWISEGAHWPDGRELAESHLSDKSWWSLRPLKAASAPEVRDANFSQWPRNEIDRFVLRKLRANDLVPAPEADRRTLIRRLYFDLVGLPPTPQAIEGFVNDTRPDFYERLVEQLIGSPRYGERWARYWLDVVHYGDTHGYDKDKPREHAWPYRDYVIRSLNADKPWSRFVQEQIAGDVLYPHTRDGVEALGFIAAGPWDYVGHVEVSEDKTDGKIARHLDRDDMVRTTMQSFIGLTVGCAQCHDHKFDPVTQLDYYQLQAVFAGLDRADKTYDIDPETGRQRLALENAIGAAKRQMQTLRETASLRASEELAEIDTELQAARLKKSSDSPAFGYHSKIDQKQTVEKWVQVDLGEEVSVRRVVLHPCKDDFNNIGAGFGFPVRFKIQLSSDANFSQGNAFTVADETEGDVANPKLNAVVYPVAGFKARYLRVTATKLAPRKDDFIFALAEVELFDAAGLNRAEGAEVSAFDSIEAGPRWSRNNLTDGQFPVDSSRVESFVKKRDDLVLAAMSDEERKLLENLQNRLAASEQQLETLPQPAKVYAGTVHQGKGNFVGTGDARNPRPVHRLLRGDVNQPNELVEPGALSILGLDHLFALDDNHSEADRRAALAEWLTDTGNPLTWRNIVNRIWLHHFGRGIVETTNDFGRMGGTPSHPELLDYLATDFRDRGQSLKQLHRMIVTSATYRQSSQPQESSHTHAKAVDSENRLLWKMRRRKLEAEAIRDSVLLLSGKLDLTMYGPGYRDFVLQHPEHSPHYEYHLHDPDDPATHRRSVFRFIVRSQLEPFMNTLDCADPSILVGRRNQSLTPLQSLTMLNSGLMVTMANHFGERLNRQSKQVDQQVRQGFYAAIGRPPTPNEHELLVDVARQHGLANACRLIFNLNEFSFIE
jgi:hypothetical protein